MQASTISAKESSCARCAKCAKLLNMTNWERMTPAEQLADARAYYLEAEHLTPAERRAAVAWVDAGMPDDEPTDVGFEEGDFC